MKAYKLEVLVVDHDGIGGEEIRDTIENTEFPNHCISPEVMAIQEREIGEWHDNHPLNDNRTAKVHYQQLFNNS